MIKEKIIANLIFLIHFIVVLTVLFGWLISSFWYIYILTIVLSLVSEVSLGYCILSKWEFALRKKINPKVDYDYSFTSFYTHKFSGKYLHKEFYQKWATIFLTLSLLINLYFRFFY